MLLTGISLHVPIGLYSLPVPLGAILIAAVIVVAASFLLIYLLPLSGAQGGRVLTIRIWSWIPIALTALGFAYIAFLVLIAGFGRQGLAALNAASLLFWVWTIPLLPLIHCFVGGLYEASNPFAFIALKLSGGRRLVNADQLLARLGYWPAVVLLFLLVEGEGITEIVQNPALLGGTAWFYLCFQIILGILFGEAWYRSGEVFHAITSLASTIAPVAVGRDGTGAVRLSVGFDPARFLPLQKGRQALITLWLGGVLADGIRATPIWRVLILPQTQPIFEQMGKFAGIDWGSASETTLEIVVTWIAFSTFFWIFASLASWLSALRATLRLHGRAHLSRIAQVVSPALIPIALAYLFAHNLTQLLVVGPLIVTARDASASQLGVLTQDQIRHLSPGVVWWVQVSAIVLGHIIAVIMAHARLASAFGSETLAVAASGRRTPVGSQAQSFMSPMKQFEALSLRRRADDPAFRADLGWLSAMLIYTATSLWILAQPITASR